MIMYLFIVSMLGVVCIAIFIFCLGELNAYSMVKV